MCTQKIILGKLSKDLDTLDPGFGSIESRPFQCMAKAGFFTMHYTTDSHRDDVTVSWKEEVV
jgi:hypothetical protein